jgi:hypothetical protein
MWGASVSEVAKEKVPFDFETHRKNAVDQYTPRNGPLYEELGWEIENILTEAIETRGLKSKINAIQSRAKEVPSFGKKAMTPNEQDSEEPKYKNPLSAENSNPSTRGLLNGIDVIYGGKEFDQMTSATDPINGTTTTALYFAHLNKPMTDFFKTRILGDKENHRMRGKTGSLTLFN